MRVLVRGLRTHLRIHAVRGPMQGESSLNRLKLSKERQREVETLGALFVRRPHRSKDPVNSAIFSVGLKSETVTATMLRRVRRTDPELTQSVRGRRTT